MKTFVALLAITVLFSSCTTIKFNSPGGILLGECAVDSTDQTGRVVVEKYDGTLKSIRFMVNGNDLELSNIVVVFDGGQRQKIDKTLLLSVGALSQQIGLENAEPIIQSIEFSYRTVGDWSSDRANDRADVLVYGVK
jgi:hypothetical protein